MRSRAPVVCIVAPGSGYGKTALIDSLLAGLKQQGIKACVLKHSGHDFEPDVEKDTWFFRQAGAIGSAVITEAGLASFYVPCSTLESSLAILEGLEPDIILCEGFKESNLPKILLLKAEDEFGIIPSLTSVLAVVYDSEYPEWVKVPVLKQAKEVLNFLLDYHRRSKEGLV
ncbi:MAG: molybdopterin-guanine dinucleotide biosynthesis protein B [Candidatus Methanomethylicaceae archaeon]